MVPKQSSRLHSEPGEGEAWALGVGWGGIVFDRGSYFREGNERSEYSSTIRASACKAAAWGVAGWSGAQQLAFLCGAQAAEPSRAGLGWQGEEIGEEGRRSWPACHACDQRRHRGIAKMLQPSSIVEYLRLINDKFNEITGSRGQVRFRPDRGRQYRPTVDLRELTRVNLSRSTIFGDLIGISIAAIYFDLEGTEKQTYFQAVCSYSSYLTASC